MAVAVSPFSQICLYSTIQKRLFIKMFVIWEDPQFMTLKSSNYSTCHFSYFAHMVINLGRKIASYFILRKYLNDGQTFGNELIPSPSSK